MATRSSISLTIENTTKTIYCHWDGGLDHNGKILNEHYNTIDKVKELINLGDISSLNETIETTVAYKRDRNETGTEARTYASKKVPEKEYQLYNYQFINNEWLTGNKKLKNLI